jgi:hypothetical protein
MNCAIVMHVYLISLTEGTNTLLIQSSVILPNY